MTVRRQRIIRDTTRERLQALAADMDTWAIPLREVELLRQTVRELLAIMLNETTGGLKQEK